MMNNYQKNAIYMHPEISYNINTVYKKDYRSNNFEYCVANLCLKGTKIKKHLNFIYFKSFVYY